ncbi:MAG: cyclic pyranopterin monophosphate synthase MoaC [Planctomycetes bacterium]|nr:cyclic pyranopterin monophosphate synthase MoaC [Planctomycetota bacterium]MCD7897429.1 cyclic pyranopterin monophosphate synthase MoaC [Planctomycetaceae bacterium]
MSSHLDSDGRARMVDVSGKAATARTAVAAGRLEATAAIVRAVRDNALAKGDALAVARVAAIMAVKNTSRVIPLCHDIAVASCQVEFDLGESVIDVRCRVTSTGLTGVEMEALHGVAVALLTLYDMAKSMDKGMVVRDIRLLSKSGGKSGDYAAPEMEA